MMIIDLIVSSTAATSGWKSLIHKQPNRFTPTPGPATIASLVIRGVFWPDISICHGQMCCEATRYWPEITTACPLDSIRHNCIDRRIRWIIVPLSSTSNMTVYIVVLSQYHYESPWVCVKGGGASLWLLKDCRLTWELSQEFYCQKVIRDSLNQILFFLLFFTLHL